MDGRRRLYCPLLPPACRKLAFKPRRWAVDRTSHCIGARHLGARPLQRQAGRKWQQIGLVSGRPIQFCQTGSIWLDWVLRQGPSGPYRTLFMRNKLADTASNTIPFMGGRRRASPGDSRPPPPGISAGPAGLRRTPSRAPRQWPCTLAAGFTPALPPHIPMTDCPPVALVPLQRIPGPFCRPSPTADRSAARAIS